jgi:multiple sugar transport system permease protein
MVWPLLLIAVMFRAIEAFRQFDLVYILTNGGPGVSTETLSYQVYKVAFNGFNTGTAAAYGILMIIVVIVLAQFYLRYLNKLKEG